MGRFIARRLLRSLLTVWVVVTAVFLVFRLIGDPMKILIPETAPQVIKDHYREKWGLNTSLPEQYVRYFASVIQGDLGRSFASGRNVADVIGEALPNTLLLGSATFLLAATLGIGLGVFSALHAHQRVDNILMFLSVIAFSLPDYFLGILLIILFGLQLRLLPTSGASSWQHLILPLMTLSAASSARITRFARAAMLDVLNEPYLNYARAKGLSERHILFRHVLRNAAIPVVTILGLQLGYIVAGATVVENVFAWPGIGRLLVQAVSFRDLPLIQAIVIVITISVTLASLAVDIAYSLVDPRIRVMRS